MVIPIKGILIFLVLAVILAVCFKDDIWKSFSEFKNGNENEKEEDKNEEGENK